MIMDKAAATGRGTVPSNAAVGRMFSFRSSPAQKSDNAAVVKPTYVPYDEPSSAAQPAHASTSQQPVHPQQPGAAVDAAAPAASPAPTLMHESRPAGLTTQRRDETTFEEAHRRTCLRLRSLHASRSQVAASLPDDVRVPVPSRQGAVLWGGPDNSSGSKDNESSVDADGSSAALSFLEKYANGLGWKEPDAANFSRKWTSSSLTPASSEASSSSSSSLLATAAKSLTKRLSFGGGDGSSGPSRGRDGATPFRVQPHDLMVCESLVLDCLQLLMRAAQSKPTTNENQSHAWLLQGSDEYSFRHWLEAAATSLSTDSTSSTSSASQQDVPTFLASLPSSSVLWLLRLLEYGHVVRVKRSGPDEPAVVVLLTAEGAEASVERCVATLHLLRTRSRLRREAQKAEDVAADLQRQALRQRQSNASKAVAVSTFQRSKMYMERAGQCHQTLVTVEHSLILLESSVMNQEVVQAIQEANRVLKEQRLDLDALDDVVEDMVEHVEHEQQVRDTFENSNKGTLPLDALDEEELLRELEKMTVGGESKLSSTTAQLRTDAPTPPGACSVPPNPTAENEKGCAAKPAPALAS